MTNINVRVAAGEDDAHDDAVEGGFPNFANNSTELYMGWNGTNNTIYGAARFLLATDIPDGSTADDGYLEFTDRDFGGSNKFIDVHAEKSLTPAAYTASFTGRSLTTAKVDLDYTVAGGATFRTPDDATGIKVLVQELIDDLSGDIQDLSFIWRGDAAQTGQSNHDIYAFEADSAKAVLLNLNYTAGGGGEPAVVVRRRGMLLGVGR